MINIDELKKKIEESDVILVGIGEEFAINDNIDNLINAYNCLNDLIKGKNYFIVSICQDNVIFKSNLNKEQITAPFCEEYVNGLDNNEEDPQWERYMLWLSCTLNKRLLILELGVSIMNPQIIRWPFEKTVELNNKAELIRINNSMPNVPAEISSKCLSKKINALEFLIV